MPVRMKDIALKLGVSVVTVSKALRGLPGIGPETTARVQNLAKEMNYSPNLVGRALALGHTYSIGLVIPDLVHPFFAQIAKSLTAALHEGGYSLVIACSAEDAAIEKRAVEQFVAKNVDALVIASAQASGELFRWIEEQKVPYLLIDRKFADMDAHFVGVDDRRVGILATEHLVEMGCLRIAHLGGRRLSSALGRRKGYEQTLFRHGLQVSDSYVLVKDRTDKPSEVVGYENARQLLRLDPMPDGIFCYNDPTATGALMACLEAGLRVPEDIAIVGCGNSNYDEFLRVPLSSVDQKSEGLGRRAGEITLRLVTSRRARRPESVFLEPELIVRASSQKRSPWAAVEPLSGANSAATPA